MAKKRPDQSCFILLFERFVESVWSSSQRTSWHTKQLRVAVRNQRGMSLVVRLQYIDANQGRKGVSDTCPGRSVCYKIVMGAVEAISHAGRLEIAWEHLNLSIFVLGYQENMLHCWEPIDPKKYRVGMVASLVQWWSEEYFEVITILIICLFWFLFLLWLASYLSMLGCF